MYLQGVARARSRSRDAKAALQRDARASQAQIEARKKELLEARDHRLRQFLEKRSGGENRMALPPPPPPPVPATATADKENASASQLKLDLLRRRVQSRRGQRPI